MSYPGLFFKIVSESYTPVLSVSLQAVYVMSTYEHPTHYFLKMATAM